MRRARFYWFLIAIPLLFACRFPAGRPTSSAAATPTSPPAKMSQATETNASVSSTPPLASGWIGFAGCSFTNNAIKGYQALGGKRFWDPIPPYRGGRVTVWAKDLTNQNRYWQGFDSALQTYNATSIIWWQLCNSPDDDEESLYHDALRVLEEIHRRVPGATIYVSAQHAFSDGNVCRLDKADGPARMQKLANRLVKEGVARAGPVMGPLTGHQTTDGCHANQEGMNLLGQQLLAFFGEGSASLPTPAVSASNERLTLYEIDPAKHPLAVCNDGSTPVFYYRRGSGDGANKWVFWLKGGGGCMDAQSCAGREHELTSSEGLPQSKRGEGILSHLSEQNPDFYNWNHVLMHYCTSDSWSGAREDNLNEMNWYFRGHYVLNAIVDATMDENMVGSPTLSQATHILFTGSSAGAHGLYYNIDRLAQTLPWADVRGVADAGLGFMVNPELSSVSEQRKKSQWETWNPILDESCLAANSSAPESCLETHLLVNGNYITTPVFARVDLFDPLALENNQLDPRDSADRPLILTFAETIADILKRQSGAFGTAARQHVMLETPEFHSYQVEGLTFAQVLGNWYFKRNAPTLVIETNGR